MAEIISPYAYPGIPYKRPRELPIEEAFDLSVNALGEMLSLKPKEILSRSRVTEKVATRHLLMFLISILWDKGPFKTVTYFSTLAHKYTIGRDYWDGLDHSTICHAENNVLKSLTSQDPSRYGAVINDGYDELVDLFQTKGIELPNRLLLQRFFEQLKERRKDNLKRRFSYEKYNQPELPGMWQPGNNTRLPTLPENHKKGQSHHAGGA